LVPVVHVAGEDETTPLLKLNNESESK
jgi:hypothetical protein